MLKKLTIVAFAILALAAFSACDDGGGEDPIITKGPDTNLGIEGGECKLDETCNSGLTCDTGTKICIKLLPICEGEICDDIPEPAPECAIDADCDSGKLCNSGKCEDIGGGGDEGGGGGNGGGSGGSGNSIDGGWGDSGTGGDSGDGDYGRGSNESGGGNDGRGSRSGDGGNGGSGSRNSGGGKAKVITYLGTQGLLLGTDFKYAMPLPITFPDANLKKAVIDAIKQVDQTFNKSDITPADCAKITFMKYVPDGGDNDVWCEDAPGKEIESLEGLQYCPGIKTLDLSCNQIANISALKNLTKLTELYLYDNKLCDLGSPCAENMQVIAGLTNLKQLGLGFNNISDISALKNLTKLTDLHLYNNNNISDISPLKNLTNLTWLNLGFNNISDISALKSLTNLTWLNLYDNNISNISALKNLTKLTDLHLYDNKLCDSGSPCTENMKVIAGLTNLKQLGLGFNNISDISVLKKLTNLTWLYLSYNEYIYDIYPLVLIADTGGFSEEGSQIYLNGITITNMIKSNIQTLESKGITVYYDGKQ